VPFVILGTELAWVLLRSVPVQARGMRDQLDMFSEKHTWIMTLLYVITFGTFAGFAAVFFLGWAVLSLVGVVAWLFGARPNRRTTLLRRAVFAGVGADPGGGPIHGPHLVEDGELDGCQPTSSGHSGCVTAAWWIFAADGQGARPGLGSMPGLGAAPDDHHGRPFADPTAARTCSSNVCSPSRALALSRPIRRLAPQ
jgi:hypothetical protein